MIYTLTESDILDARETRASKVRAYVLREENKRRTARHIITARESVRASFRGTRA